MAKAKLGRRTWRDHLVWKVVIGRQDVEKREERRKTGAGHGVPIRVESDLICATCDTGHH